VAERFSASAINILAVERQELQRLHIGDGKAASAQRSELCEWAAVSDEDVLGQTRRERTGGRAGLERGGRVRRLSGRPPPHEPKLKPHGSKHVRPDECNFSFVEIRLLGTLEVVDGSGKPVIVAGAKLRALLALLATCPGRVVSVDRLVADRCPPFHLSLIAGRPFL
jgi:hypothetical protein